MFSTQEVLEVAKQAEEETVAKKGRKRSHTPSIDMEISAQEDEVLDNVCGNPSLICTVGA